MNSEPVEKTEEQKLCEKYGGEWLSKDIWEDGDACEFVYLSVGNLWYHEPYFDGDEPNEDFYLQSERDQKDIIIAKNHTSSLEEKYQKEINVAKEYCKEVGGKFEKGVRGFKRSADKYARYPLIVIDYWVVRCRIK